MEEFEVGTILLVGHDAAVDWKQAGGQRGAVYFRRGEVDRMVVREEGAGLGQRCQRGHVGGGDRIGAQTIHDDNDHVLGFAGGMRDTSHACQRDQRQQLPGETVGGASWVHWHVIYPYNGECEAFVWQRRFLHVDITGCPLEDQGRLYWAPTANGTSSRREN
jgi:hypothetical protein